MNTDKIREYLDSSLDTIDGKTLEDLKSARQNALSRYEAHELVLEGHGALHFRHPRIGVWLPTAAFVLGVCAILYWGTAREAPPPDSTDIDAALLADDLPVPAYTDQKFFDSWLNRSQQ